MFRVLIQFVFFLIGLMAAVSLRAEHARICHSNQGQIEKLGVLQAPI
jgi:hypothetical protein